ncbi:hypothetical protein ACTHT6_12105, partial [Neisseria sp. P0022.S006]
PDLTVDKLSKVFLVYESELVRPGSTGKRKHGVLGEVCICGLVGWLCCGGCCVVFVGVGGWFVGGGGWLLVFGGLGVGFVWVCWVFGGGGLCVVVGGCGVFFGCLCGVCCCCFGVGGGVVLVGWWWVGGCCVFVVVVGGCGVFFG